VIFLNIFFLIYSLLPFTYYFRRKESHDLRGFYILLPNSLVAFAFNFAMIRERFSVEWVGLVTVFYALLFLAFAYELYRQGEKQRNALIVMLLKSAFFLVITIPVLLSGHWITIFWLIQAALLLQGAIMLKRRSFLFAAYSLLSLGLGKFLVYDLTTYFSYDLWQGFILTAPFAHLLVGRWLTMVSILLVLLRCSYLAKGEIGLGSTIFSPEEAALPRIFSAAFGGFLFFFLTLETSAFFYEYLPQARFAALSLIWALFAVFLMQLGFRRNDGAVRRTAMGLIFATLIKVFLFDIGNISTPYRILSFVVLGLILILISYLYNRARLRLLGPEEKERK
jgi:hypothetical protein